jgi:hypothetical protein
VHHDDYRSIKPAAGGATAPGRHQSLADTSAGAAASFNVDSMHQRSASATGGTARRCGCALRRSSTSAGAGSSARAARTCGGRDRALREIIALVKIVNVFFNKLYTETLRICPEELAGRTAEETIVNYLHLMKQERNGI